MLGILSRGMNCARIRVCDSKRKVSVFLYFAFFEIYTLSTDACVFGRTCLCRFALPEWLSQKQGNFCCGLCPWTGYYSEITNTHRCKPGLLLLTKATFTLQRFQRSTFEVAFKCLHTEGIKLLGNGINAFTIINNINHNIL